MRSCRGLGQTSHGPRPGGKSQRLTLGVEGFEELLHITGNLECPLQGVY